MTSGKRTEFELVDGKYRIAPEYASRFSEIAQMETAVKDTLAAVVEQTTRHLTVINSHWKKWWDEVYDDLGLDESVEYEYLDGVVQPLVEPVHEKSE